MPRSVLNTLTKSQRKANGEVKETMDRINRFKANEMAKLAKIK
jgi:hypothetical protein